MGRECAARRPALPQRAAVSPGRIAAGAERPTRKAAQPSGRVASRRLVEGLNPRKWPGLETTARGCRPEPGPCHTAWGEWDLRRSLPPAGAGAQRSLSLPGQRLRWGHLCLPSSGFLGASLSSPHQAVFPADPLGDFCCCYTITNLSYFCRNRIQLKPDFGRNTQVALSLPLTS